MEKTKRKKKVSFKRLSGWASLLRNVFSILGGCISFITLFILLKQNERTYRPDIILTPEHSFFSAHYSENPRACDDIRMDSVAAWGGLNLVAANLGLGAAKNLRLKWLYDPNQLDDTVQIGSLVLPTHVHFNHELNGTLFESCFMEEHNEASAEFCLPVNQEKISTQFPLPKNFVFPWINLLIRIGQAQNIPKEQRNGLISEFVRKFQGLKVAVSYSDINNQSYTREYSIFLVPGYLHLAKREMVISILTQEEGMGPHVPKKCNLTIMDEGNTFFIDNFDL